MLLCELTFWRTYLLCSCVVSSLVTSDSPHDTLIERFKSARISVPGCFSFSLFLSTLLESYNFDYLETGGVAGQPRCWALRDKGNNHKAKVCSASYNKNTRYRHACPET